MSPPPLLLDLDGVLVDSAAVHAAAWQSLFEPFGIAFGPDRYAAEANGRSRGDVIRAVLGERTDHQALMDRKANLVVRILNGDGCPEVPGARAFLEAAHRRGCPLAIATASRMPRPFLAAAGLEDLVEIIVDRSMVSRGKPAPDAYLLAAERLGVDPRDAWVVEDSPTGLAAARAAGCHTIGITTNHPRSALNAEHVVDELRQVWPAILR